MSNNSYLYLLVFPKLNAFKIGKANDIKSRYDQLKTIYGDADLSNSYYVQSNDVGHIFKLEKMLHFLFQDFNLKDQLKVADGYTEFFDLSILDNVLTFLHSPTTPLNMVNTRFSVHKGITINNNTPKPSTRQSKLLDNQIKQAHENHNYHTAQLFNQFMNIINSKHIDKLTFKEVQINHLLSDVQHEQSMFVIEPLAIGEIDELQTILDGNSLLIKHSKGCFNLIPETIVKENVLAFSVGNYQRVKNMFEQVIDDIEDDNKRQCLVDCRDIIKYLADGMI